MKDKTEKYREGRRLEEEIQEYRRKNRLCRRCAIPTDGKVLCMPCLKDMGERYHKAGYFDFKK